MHVSKLYTFTASVICQLAAGLAYCFSLYSAALKERFGYSQEQIEGVGSACNLGGYLSLPSGLFYDWLASRGHDHLGPRWVHHPFVDACAHGIWHLVSANIGLFTRTQPTSRLQSRACLHKH